MKCMKCNGKCKCFDTRPIAGGTWRRYRCKICQHRFSTAEYAVTEGSSGMKISERDLIRPEKKKHAEAMAAIKYLLEEANL
jgi:transcriptional regulator NrdR family protein